LMTFFSYIRRELGISRKEVEPQILKGGWKCVLHFVGNL
jgi:hypothetical protein